MISEPQTEHPCRLVCGLWRRQSIKSATRFCFCVNLKKKRCGGKSLFYQNSHKRLDVSGRNVRTEGRHSPLGFLPSLWQVVVAFCVNPPVMAGDSEHPLKYMPGLCSWELGLNVFSVTSLGSCGGNFISASLCQSPWLLK